MLKDSTRIAIRNGNYTSPGTPSLEESPLLRVLRRRRELRRRRRLELALLGRREGHEVDALEACVEIKISRRVRAESSRRPPRHRRDACSMAWRCRFLAARPSQDGRAIAAR